MPDTTVGARRQARGNDGWAFPDLVVEAWGDLACFTRPELKSERVSYQLMTPSAANGLLQAIFWKPQFQYVVRRIEVLRPVQWHLIRRNEVRSVTSLAGVKAMAKDRAQRYDVEADRDQRSTMALTDVWYRIHAQVVVDRAAKAGGNGFPPASEEKYREQLRRRVERGACFSQPFFGCREFTASFGPAGSGEKALRGRCVGEGTGLSGVAPEGWTEELGLMLHSIEYPAGGGERYRWFRAQVVNGALDVPREPLPQEAVAMPQGPWRADGAEV
ncbi:type I-C CRISPR-associated protein Cas5c [Streptomyces spiramenti]|uniref:pre-crRNA processing endonuclease n=1 Tax=Streptomyces spiramenti TaxID=2720606 RepID=A0ABX1AJM5_9ACTN|nr:type I-C CRISPR-associated protein Cas5c [Streptomyces spiramenti]NJP64803.1 type I-C CRISPR-associated protein Cas5 [Streptomyces spiramenti]